MGSAEDVVLAEVIRSGVVESRHRGCAVVVGADGAVLAAWGDPKILILPRSANKPGQATAMVTAGLTLDEELLALTAASHSGEAFHRQAVERMLDEAGIAADALRTPADLPYDPIERERYLAAGAVASPVAMNCSGKHAAMLLTAAARGWTLEDYLSNEHPLQQHIHDEIASLSGERPWTTAVDGCGAPMFGLSLIGLARMGSAHVVAATGTAPRRVADAMRAHPEWVSGTRRDSRHLMAGVPGLLAKEGADGVYLVALDDGRAVAVKVTDGADRARPVIMAAILARLGVQSPIVDEQRESPVLGGGVQVGVIRGVI